MPMGQVTLVMFEHSVVELWYCPGGHMKTQQTSLMMTLLGAHGGEVELVVEVRLLLLLLRSVIVSTAT